MMELLQNLREEKLQNKFQIIGYDWNESALVGKAGSFFVYI